MSVVYKRFYSYTGILGTLGNSLNAGLKAGYFSRRRAL